MSKITTLSTFGLMVGKEQLGNSVKLIVVVHDKTGVAEYIAEKLRSMIQFSLERSSDGSGSNQGLDPEVSWKIIYAPSGEKLLSIWDKIKKQTYGLIIHKDLGQYHSEGMGVGRLIQEIRKTPDGNLVPIYLTSGEYSFDPEVKNTVMALGAQWGGDLVTDPSSWGRLIKMIAKYQNLLTPEDLELRKQEMEQFQHEGSYWLDYNQQRRK